MPNFKSSEFVQDSGDSSDEAPRPDKNPAKEIPKLSALKQNSSPTKKEKKSKKDKKEKKAKKEKKVKKEKERIPEKPSPKKKRTLTKRPLSSASEASDIEDVPVKKAPAKKSKPNNTNQTSDEEVPKIEIGTNRFVSVRSFKGKTYLDIREFFMTPHGLAPGKKGVTLKREQWNFFKEMFFDVDEKVRTAGPNDDEPIDFGGNKRLAVSRFKGKYLLIDIREMYQKDGEDRPGKGIALKPENYEKIKEFQDDIDKLW